MTLDTKLQHLPPQPGVYLFKDAGGEILYIGKAKSLRARVRSYFSRGRDPSLKTRELVRRTADVDTIVVGSEAEALLLEANLIKAHRPRFNIQLRDDKRYPYIKVTLQEPFPRVFVTRRLENDGARYFGPFTDVRPMRQALDVIKRLYTVRSCRYDLPREAPARPCLDYHIGRCQAPCVGLQSRTAYGAMVDEILEILAGRTAAVRERIEHGMQEAAEALDFERAAHLRDVRTGLESIERRQRMMDVRGGDQDVVGTARDGDRACAVLLRIRDGKLLGREVDFFGNIAEEAEDALLAAAASRFYLGRGADGTADLPREILFPLEFEDRRAVEALVGEAAGRRVHTHVPRRGDKLRLIELASQNARHLLEEQVVLHDAAQERADDALYALQEALELKVVPRSLVCFDISHTQGTEVVGSAVFFENGVPNKGEYRRFRVRGAIEDRSEAARGAGAAVEGTAVDGTAMEGAAAEGAAVALTYGRGNDDFRSIAEVVGRYFARRHAEEKPLPALAVIDGGKGQLGAAAAALDALGLRDVALCALAKREEEVYLPGRTAPLRLPRTSAALHLLQRARDEAHRFAHGYNRTLRKRRTLSSELAAIPGIGPTRQRALLARFGSVRALRAAAADEIAAVPGFSEKLARQIAEHLNRS